MESVKSFIFFPSIAGVLLLGITLIVNLIFLKTLFDSIVTSVLVGFVHENARG